MSKVKLKELDTYVYIDSSNIRNALRVSRREIDWKMLYDYLSKSYKRLKTVSYFEGVDKTDKAKIKGFNDLEKYGYDIKTLERKSYKNSAKYKTFKCRNCKDKNTVKILKESKTLKSNIDVYLCSELLGELLKRTKETHVIILTCDGDYAEMISNLLDKNSKIHVSVFSTPFTKSNNYLSVRLKELEREDRYHLVNILNIKDRVSIQIGK